MHHTINVKLPRLEETWSTVSIRRYSADRYAYENISSQLQEVNVKSVDLVSETSFVMNKVCFLCLNPSRLKCSRCLTIQYCSKECQKKDWKVHKNNCEDSNCYDNNYMDQLRSKASNYMLQGNYLKAEKAYLRLLAMVEEQLTDQEVDKIGVLNCLSEAYRRQGEKEGWMEGRAGRRQMRDHIIPVRAYITWCRWMAMVCVQWPNGTSLPSLPFIHNNRQI